MKSNIKAVLIALIAVSFFTTCDSPMGMGDQIDFEPPVLIMDPVSNPFYIGRGGAVLTGTVTDNIFVERVIFINVTTGQELFPVERTGEKWMVELMFTEEQNGEKIIGQIIAYDRAGNSGASSIAFVTMIVDIRPPIVDNIAIQRTDTRIARLETLKGLKGFETTDPLGEDKDALYKYQNGWFSISGVVNDEETKIEIISLDFYDVRELKFKLLSLPVDEGYTNYFPHWSIKEENIINAGVNKWGESYKTDYYKEDGLRYYYRVVVTAIDKSGNENVPVEEDEGYLCLFARSDKPKGIFDVSVAPKGTVSRGTPLPVDFYDDDSLLWAYTGLLTYEQWHGQKPVYDTEKISGSTDDERLSWLKNRFRAGGTVYDWKFDKHAGLSDSNEAIQELIKYNEADPKSLDEKLIYLPTGNGENDYGDYFLFTLVADKKLAPHDGKGPEWTNNDIWIGRSWPIAVVDENIPLIVFDTSNGCPEENTFPLLVDGEYFNINGYTLRENATGEKKVITFRAAWIPFGLKDESKGKYGPDDYITEVQEALRKETYTTPAGVQYWDFMKSNLIEEGVEDKIDDYIYIKQNFSKKFSVLGKKDDTNGLKNFTFNNELENNTKVFVFYAVDNMGHEVFRQLRLLGMKIPPTLTVYDISNEVKELPTRTSQPYTLPDPNDSGNTNPATGGVTSAYFTLLNAYNSDPTVYNTLRNISVNIPSLELAKLETIPFQIYPRGTVLKYWIKAAKSERDIAITGITMKDVTFASSSSPVIGIYNADDMAYTYCESFPDVTQRTFLIEATDALGNVAQIQRTIAVTNAARLESITTTSESGTYGIGKKIILTAKFSNQIYINGGGIPLLNIRYGLNGGGWKYAHLNCKNPPNITSPKMNLEFEFTVPDETSSEKASGQLQTLYDDSMFTPLDFEKRPIIVPEGTTIMDSGRNDAAFLPGYVNDAVSVPNWTAVDQQSLQKTKNIRLDGVRPVIKAPVVAGGKDPYTKNNPADPDSFYFKTGESIQFTLTATKAVMASGTPRLSYKVNGVQNNTAFAYQRPNGNDSLVFVLPVNKTNCEQDGVLTDVNLISSGGLIIDDVENSVSNVDISDLLPLGTIIYVRQNPPAAPAATLAGSTFGTSPDTVINYNSNPALVIPRSGDPFVDSIEYSLNGGYQWTHYSNAATQSISVPPGTHNLMVRYKDMAGNESSEHRQRIQVKDTFPKLIQVSASNPNGWYKEGSNLEFNLSFEDTVKVDNISNVSIMLWNYASSTPPTAGQKTLTASTGQTGLTTTIKFSWTGISGNEMRDGLYIREINLSGLKDSFGNSGGSGTSTYNTDITITPVSGVGDNYTCPKLPTGIRVDAIAPSVSTRVPAHNDMAPSGNDLVKEIKLTFNESVMKGSGVITVRPHGYTTYAVPPVLDDTGYYLGYTDNGQATGTEGPTETYPTKFSTPGPNRTYVSSFLEIYNSLTNSTYRGYLVEGNTSNLPLKARAAINTGPYIKTTQGLVTGLGYTGSYSGTGVTNGTNAPDATAGKMIPDTATKWVLDYKYGIAQNTEAVNNIRTALTNAKWRWQEIEVTSVSVSGENTSTITVTLNEPLLKGLEWDVYYPAGTFTDMAGNPAPASGNSTNANPTQWSNTDYFFTTPGVQAPVIRVNRRSSDSRTSNWSSPSQAYAEVTDPTGSVDAWNSINMTISNDESNGWSKTNFNTIHYRVESETLSATVTAQYYQGAATAASKGAAKGAWSNNVQDVNYTDNNFAASAWNAAASDTVGTWVLPNIIRRSRNNNNQTYTVVTKNGTETRTSAGSLRMYRSYNRDLTAAELGFSTSGALTLTGATLSSNANSKGQGVLTFDALEASKSYIVGTATITLPDNSKISTKGVEGVFRTVVMLNYTTALGQNYLSAEGSNIKNGIPSIAGFPLRDAESIDGRYVKAFFKANNIGNNGANNFYWVSTEIVSEFYFIMSGGRNVVTSGANGGHMTAGEVNNYLMVGYGDLTYAHDMTRSQ